MKYQPDIVLKWFAQHKLFPVPEHKFHSSRKWRFDFAFLESKVALEVDGGTWIQGRHSRGSGIAGDMAKFNAAALLGWRILRVTPQELCMQETVNMVKEAINL